MDKKLLRQTVDNLFTKRSAFISLQQEIAEHFYPERADFTLRREPGEEYASHLTTSYPVQCRRDLGDQIGTMLRPTSKEWMHMALPDQEREDNDSARWMEWATGLQRRAMYDPVAKFTKAMKQSDHDFAAFGQSVESVRLNRSANALLFRCYHTKDVVWMEDEDGEICLIGRKWKPYCYDLQRMFGSKCAPAIDQEARQNPFGEVNCYHIIIKSEWYDGNAKGKPYFSIYMDCSHEHVMEEVPVWNKEYNIPRWQTVPGSQYAFSPATIIALADARTIQAMAYTLLEVGEKIVNPPMVATQDAVRSDVSIYAGGITWVDYDYDERLGEALRPMSIDAKGMPIGLDMQRDTRAMLAQAFYLNKINLPRPENSKEMTAYEIGQRVQEYIRGALPIFEPMEMERNGGICELTFDLLLRSGAFGSPYNMPKALRGANIQFRFESPLHDLIEEQMGNKFIQMKGLIAEALTLDQSALALPDAKVALRDALKGIKVPAAWLRSETTVQQIEAAQQAAHEAQQTLAAMEQGSTVAANLAGAQKDLAAAGG